MQATAFALTALGVLSLSLTGTRPLTVSAWAAGSPVTTLHVEIEGSRGRQVIEGFGGSLAFWGYNADKFSRRQAIEEVGWTIVRISDEQA
jgi:hypothetical protein